MLLAGWSFALLAVSSLMVAGACVVTCRGGGDVRIHDAGANYRAALMRRDFRSARGFWVEAITGPFRRGSPMRPWYFGAAVLGLPGFVGAYVGVQIADGASIRRLIDLLS